MVAPRFGLLSSLLIATSLGGLSAPSCGSDSLSGAREVTGKTGVGDSNSVTGGGGAAQGGVGAGDATTGGGGGGATTGGGAAAAGGGASGGGVGGAGGQLTGGGQGGVGGGDGSGPCDVGVGVAASSAPLLTISPASAGESEP